MAKKPAPKRKPAKHGRKPMQLIIREDPEIALSRLLKPTTPPKRGK